MGEVGLFPGYLRKWGSNKASHPQPRDQGKTPSPKDLKSDRRPNPWNYFMAAGEEDWGQPLLSVKFSNFSSRTLPPPKY